MEEAVKKLADAVEDFIGYIRLLPPAYLAPAENKEWGPREVLIHLVFWNEEYCRIINLILKGEKPKLIRGTFKKQNELCVKANNTFTTNDLINRLIETEKKLENLCSLPEVKTIRISFKEMGKSWPIKEALEKIAGHFRNHQKKLIKAGYRIEYNSG